MPPYPRALRWGQKFSHAGMAAGLSLAIRCHAAFSSLFSDRESRRPALFEDPTSRGTVPLGRAYATVRPGPSRAGGLCQDLRRRQGPAADGRHHGRGDVAEKSSKWNLMRVASIMESQRMLWRCWQFRV